MSQKNYFRAGFVVFAAIAVLHLFRIFYGWEAVIGEAVIPLWVSWVALAVSGYLAYASYQHLK